VPKIITTQKAREIDAFCRARHGLPYAYGGAFTTDPKRSTDCSGLVLQTGAFIMGRTDWPGNRYGSTESFRLDHKIVYDIGFKRLPKGGVRELGWQPIMLVGLQHGGGGPNSHTACTLFYADQPGGPIKPSTRGIDWESSGSRGVRYYHGARAWNDPLFHDFWYLDARLDMAATHEPAPAAVLLGRDCARYECRGDRVRALQEKLNRDYPAYSTLVVDGIFGPATEAVVREFQRRSGLLVDGIAGPATLAKLGLFTTPPASEAPVKKPVVVGPADDQLNMRWNCLGGQTLVEAVAEIRDKVLGTNDRHKTGVVMADG